MDAVRIMKIISISVAAAGFTVFCFIASCQQYSMPNKKITPGVVNTKIEANLSGKSYALDGVEYNMCAPDFKTPPFRVATKSEKIKTAVCKAYGIDSGCPGKDWELDDIIPVELGGMNVQANLWPQPIVEARIKDHKVEDALGGPRGLVCKGKISLEDARTCVLTNWQSCIAKISSIQGK